MESGTTNSAQRVNQFEHEFAGVKQIISRHVKGNTDEEASKYQKRTTIASNASNMNIVYLTMRSTGECHTVFPTSADTPNSKVVNTV